MPVKVTGAPGYSAEAHPFPIMRAKHLDLWVEKGGYTKVSGKRAERMR